jgi:hypothetical protein
MGKKRTSGAEALAGRFGYGTAEAVPFVEGRSALSCSSVLASNEIAKAIVGCARRGPANKPAKASRIIFSRPQEPLHHNRADHRIHYRVERPLEEGHGFSRAVTKPIHEGFSP